MPQDAKNILIAEDDEDVLLVLATYFRQVGYTVHTAQRRAEAEAILNSQAIDLIIADSSLRGTNGNTIAASVGIPTILTSGNPAWIARLRSGATPFLAKPFRLEDLLRLAKRVLGEAP
jgi:DNA-binding NtrC family response regulator